MNPLLDDDLTGPRPPVFLAALRTATGRTPIWLTCWFVPLFLALVLAVPWRGFYAGVLAQNYEPLSVLASMDENFRFDHGPELASLKQGTAEIAAALALVAMLFGVFSGGGWLQVFLERTQGHSMRRFLWGGARYFWRFLRVWLVTLLTLALVSWIFHGWPWKTALSLLFGAEDGDLEVLRSEFSVVLVTWTQDGLYGLTLALILVWGDYTRTRLALQDTRSAVWAGLCTWGLILLHPLRTLRPMCVLFVLEAGLVVALGSVAHGLDRGLGPESGAGTLLLLFGLGQVALLWRGITRGARYHAAAQVSKQLVPPLAQPDPWASRVGGPGGPQYPLDLNDDYGVSV
ncbi:MAG: hypothetical protein HOP15_05290 [Planctomycetes bacterium]|nr:hypothetical protein [Planctomycetota bacterium]